MSDKKISVTVGGSIHSGKTHVLAAIFNVLDEAGLLDNVTLTGVDNDAKSFGEICRNVSNGNLKDVLKDVKIELVEHYGDFPTALPEAKAGAEDEPGGDAAAVEENEDVGGRPIGGAERKPYTTPVVPIVRPESVDKFVNPYIFPPTSVEMPNGEYVMTSPLKFGVRMDIMGLSQTKSLLDTGIFDTTDCLDPVISLKEIAWELNGRGMTSLVENIATAPFVAAPSGNYKDVVLNFVSYLPFEGDNQVKVSVTGTLNLEMGTLLLNAAVLESSLPPELIPQPVGFTLNANRVNYNRYMR